jgi:hypothetical protein
MTTHDDRVMDVATGACTCGRPAEPARGTL